MIAIYSKLPKFPWFLGYKQGWIQDSEKGGYNFLTVSMVIVCELSTQSGMHVKHTKSRGVWGHAPPENFEKLNPLRLNLKSEGIFNGLLSLLLQDSILHNKSIIEIYLINIYK